MKLSLLIVGLLAILIFSGCNKEGLNKNERNIVGSWQYDLVRKNGHKITNQYKDIELTFYQDFSAKIEDDKEGDSFNGTWDLVETNSGEYGSNSIFASFSSALPNQVFQLVFSDAVISRNKIQASFMDGNDSYRYRLEKD